jgi:hypothetical protein
VPHENLGLAGIQEGNAKRAMDVRKGVRLVVRRRL